MEFASLAAFLAVAMVLCLGERRIRVHLARQSGTGPHRQGPAYALATTLKLLARKPPRRPAPHRRTRRWSPLPSDRLGPVLTGLAALLALATLPTGRGLQLLPSTAGALVILTALGSALLGHQLDAGTACGSAHGGGLRGGRGLVVLLNAGLIIVGVVMIQGTADLSAIVGAQQSLFAWFLWRQPLGLALISVLILVVHDPGEPLSASAADRDVEESRCAHSGVESGLRWLGVTLTRAFLAALVVDLYLGGWSPGLALPDGSWWTLLSMLTFVAKTLVVLYGILAIRRLLPEFRPDQVQRLGWTMVLPCAVANILLTALGVTLYRLFSTGNG